MPASFATRYARCVAGAPIGTLIPIRFGEVSAIADIGSGHVFESAWEILEDQVKVGLNRHREFPLTTMSRAVAEAIWAVRPAFSSGAEPATGVLDVGTGTGVHAFLMAVRGHQRIDAIDANVDAIRLAQARYRDVWPKLQQLVSRTKLFRKPTSIVFRAEGLDYVSAARGPYSLITFNPPAYYNVLNTTLEVPVAQGVYTDGRPESFWSPESSLLYRFFERVVLPHLAPGGRVICSWPALERRVVEKPPFTTSRSELLSPPDLLRYWFGLQIDTRVTPREFFAYDASVVGGYGLGDSFWNNLSAGSRGGLYSSLVSTQPVYHQASFRFGILHLIRDRHEPKQFHYSQ